mmetsp:Transcript_24777/g.64520  ORF Transcript_24777/g.64520 Transcript_24777/m.64520 type:complete len:218 (-) Transcript_24777:6-659(-)
MLLNIKATLSWGHVDRIFSVVIDDDATVKELKSKISEVYQSTYNKKFPVELLTNGYGAAQPVDVKLSLLFENGGWVYVKGVSPAAPLLPAAAAVAFTPSRKRKRKAKAADAKPKAVVNPEAATNAPPVVPPKRAKVDLPDKAPSRTKPDKASSLTKPLEAAAPAAPAKASTNSKIRVRRTGKAGSVVGGAFNASSWSGPSINVQRVRGVRAAVGIPA